MHTKSSGYLSWSLDEMEFLLTIVWFRLRAKATLWEGESDILLNSVLALR